MEDEKKTPSVMVTGARRSYQNKCAHIRMHLVGLLARPAFGNRCWADTMKIGEALIQLDMQADSMDREAKLGRYTETYLDEDCVLP